MGMSPPILKLLAVLPLALAVASVVCERPAAVPQGVPPTRSAARSNGVTRAHSEVGADGRQWVEALSAAGPVAAGPVQLATQRAGGAGLSKPDAVPDEGENPRQPGGAAASGVRVTRVPLFYVLADEKIVASVPGLTAGGLQVLRQNFEKNAGVGLLAADDPAYAQRWQQAESSLEQQMRLWYGWSAWAAFEHQAAIEAARQPPLAAQ